MTKSRTTRSVKYWNNGWLYLAVFIALFGTLFLVGKHSKTYDPDPVIEGRLLSLWVNDLQPTGPYDNVHDKAVRLINRHETAITPSLIQWLSEEDTFAQVIYYETMKILEGKRSDYLDYRGSWHNQTHAAYAFRFLKSNNPLIDPALQEVVEQYGLGKHTASEAAERALKARLTRVSEKSDRG